MMFVALHGKIIHPCCEPSHIVGHSICFFFKCSPCLHFGYRFRFAQKPMKSTASDPSISVGVMCTSTADYTCNFIMYTQTIKVQFSAMYTNTVIKYSTQLTSQHKQTGSPVARDTQPHTRVRRYYNTRVCRLA